MPQSEFEGKTILVTGGTGSIGSQIVRRLLECNPKQVRVYSRDDSKQFNLRIRLGNDPRLRWLLGDVRDKARLCMAMENVDVVFHAGALKHVLACENDPFEAVKTNVIGTQNVIECALENGVEKFVGISTDKAADPVNVLGCTKLLGEKLMSTTYHYKGTKKTRFCFVRFGNVIGTRGSVIPLFCWQIKNGQPLTVTEPTMRRFFMTIDDAVNLIFKASNMMRDREIFVLKMPIVRIGDLAEALVELYAPKYGKDPATIRVHHVGRFNGERMFEKLLGRDECTNALETPDMFIVKPFTTATDTLVVDSDYPDAKPIVAKEYDTDSPELADRVLNKQQIKDLIRSSEDYIEASLM